MRQYDDFGEAALSIGLKDKAKEPPSMAKSKKADPFTGQWQIVSMDQWDEEWRSEDAPRDQAIPRLFPSESA